MTSFDEDSLDHDGGAAVTALAPIAFRRSAPRETIRAYWEDVHGPAISRLDGLALYTQHHLDPATGDDWPTWLAGERPEADDQLDGLAELGWASAADQATFGTGVDASRGRDDDQNFVRESTVQNIAAGNSRTYKNVIREQSPNGPVSEYFLIVGFHRRPDTAVDDFRDALRSFARSIADFEQVLKVRLHLVEPFVLSDWDAPNVTHPTAEAQYDAFLQLSFKNRLTMRLVYESEQFAAIGRGLTGAVERVHAYRAWQLVSLVRHGRRTLAGVYGGRVARTIADSGATLRWQPDIEL